MQSLLEAFVLPYLFSVVCTGNHALDAFLLSAVTALVDVIAKMMVEIFYRVRNWIKYGTKGGMLTVRIDPQKAGYWPGYFMRNENFTAMLWLLKREMAECGEGEFKVTPGFSGAETEGPQVAPVWICSVIKIDGYEYEVRLDNYKKDQLQKATGIKMESPIVVRPLDERSLEWVHTFIYRVWQQYNDYVKSKERRSLYMPDVYEEDFCEYEWVHSVDLPVHPGLSAIALPTHELSAEMKTDLEKFQNGKDKYKEMGQRYRRGYGFVGPSGSGKSTSAFAIAAHLKQNICLLDMGCSYKPAAIKDFLRYIEDDSVLLIENADMIKPNLLECILSGLDTQEDGQVVVVTSRTDSIDPRLLRGGRVDFVVELTLTTKQQAEQLYQMVIGRPLPDSSWLVEETIEPAVLMQTLVRWRHSSDSVILEHLKALC